MGTWHTVYIAETLQVCGTCTGALRYRLPVVSVRTAARWQNCQLALLGSSTQGQDLPLHQVGWCRDALDVHGDGAIRRRCPHAQ